MDTQNFKKISDYEIATFIFNSCKADARLDIISESPNENSHCIIKISSIENKKIKFAYNYGEGLILLQTAKSAKHCNILAEFLKIKENDVDAYLNFFKNYGFLFQVPANRFIALVPEIITKIAQRLKATVELMTEVNKINDIDIRKVMELSLFLLLSSEWEIDIDGTEYSSIKHPLTDLINYNAMDEIPELNRVQEITDTGGFIIKDTILGERKIDSNDYQNTIDGYNINDGKDDPYFQRIFYLYVNYPHSNASERKIIDLLYNYYSSVGIPKSMSINGISYYNRFNYVTCNSFAYDIINFGKFIIKHEIDAQISKIKPVYDETTMKPDWQIDSLLSAMYFSLFYLDSTTETLRKCKRCEKYFLVKKSNSLKIYCSENCRNNAQAERHRIKVKQRQKEE